MDGAGVGRLGKRKYDFVIIWKKKLNYQDTLLVHIFMVHIKSFKSSYLTHICIVMKVGHLSKSVSTAISSSEAIYWKKEKKLTTVVAIPQKKKNQHLFDVSPDLLVGLLATWCQNVNSQNVLFFCEESCFNTVSLNQNILVVDSCAWDFWVNLLAAACCTYRNSEETDVWTFGRLREGQIMFTCKGYCSTAGTQL